MEFLGKRLVQNGCRSPSAISSQGWRNIHLEKERGRQMKQDAILKRKEERIAKRNAKKKTGRTVRRKSKPSKTCPACKEELVSDVEEEGLKNIGCDTCPVWFHLRCTPLKDLPYFEAAESLFICPGCDA